MNILASEQTQGLVDLIQANISSLEQASTIIKALPADKYNHVASPYFESCLGKHMRHILDHYLCFIRDIETGMIDYDKRDRDARIETDREYTLSVIGDICEFLVQMRDVKTADKPVNVQLCNDVGHPNGEITYSSLGRELQFLHGHSVHHYALIATMLRFYGVAIEREFGVAPSTLVHEGTVKASA